MLLTCYHMSDKIKLEPSESCFPSSQSLELDTITPAEDVFYSRSSVALAFAGVVYMIWYILFDCLNPHDWPLLKFGPISETSAFCLGIGGRNTKLGVIGALAALILLVAMLFASGHMKSWSLDFILWLRSSPYRQYESLYHDNQVPTGIFRGSSFSALRARSSAISPMTVSDDFQKVTQ